MFELIWIILLSIYGLLSLVASIFLYIRADYTLLKVRNPSRMALQIFSGFVMVTMICFREINRSVFPCWVYIIITNMFTPLFFLPLFSLATSLQHTHDYEQLIDDDDDDINDYIDENDEIKDIKTSIETVNSYNNNMKRKQGIMNVVYSIVLTLHMIVSGIQAWFASQSGDLTEGCQWQSEGEFILLAIISACYALAFTCITYWLRGIYDPFKVANELRFAFGWSLVCTTAFFVMNLVPGLQELDSVWPFSTIILLMLFVLLVVTILWPIYNATQAIYEGIIPQHLTDHTKEYNTIIDYLECDIAFEKLLVYHKNKNKSNNIHLEMFITLYNYVSYPTCRNVEIASSLYTYITKTAPQNIFANITSDAYSKIATVINHNTTPNGDLFKIFLIPVRDHVNSVCINVFYQSNDYSTMMDIIKKRGIVAANYRTSLNNNEMHINVLDYPITTTTTNNDL